MAASVAREPDDERRVSNIEYRVSSYTTPVQDERAYAVIVVSHDHAGTLPACLGAVASLNPPPHEVVVVDNASVDGSAELVEGWSSSTVRLIRETTNIGFAAAVNRGLAVTDAPWVLLLNPDCAPRSNFVGALMETAAGRPEWDRIGSITGRLLRAEDASLSPSDVLDAAGMVVTPSGRHFDRGAGEPDDGRYSQPAWLFGGTGAATLFRRTALEDVAYQDGQILAESFFAYREDAELAWRLQWRAWRCLYVPDAVAVHGRGFRPEAGRRGHEAVNRLSVRNRFLLRIHCADWGWHLRCFPWWKIRDLMVIGACFTIETSSLPALAEVWRGRGDALSRRRWVLSRRRCSSRHISRWFRRRGWAEEMEAE
jgi:GT2 family glycosyltransferase